MKIKNIFFGLVLVFASCSQIQKTNHTEGEIITTTGPETFQARYKGKSNLKVGDKIEIFQYEDFAEDLKHRESRNMPSSIENRKKKAIGSATVSTVLDDNYYELKLDHPQYIPPESFIEKL